VLTRTYRCTLFCARIRTNIPILFLLSRFNIILPSGLGLFGSIFHFSTLNKILYAFDFCPMHATCFLHFILDLTTLLIFGEEYAVRIRSDFLLLPLGLNILLGDLLSNPPIAVISSQTMRQSPSVYTPNSSPFTNCGFVVYI
jgi:hypothetical protein